MTQLVTSFVAWCLVDDKGVPKSPFVRWFAWYPILTLIKEPAAETDHLPPPAWFVRHIRIKWLCAVYRQQQYRRGPFKYMALTPALFLKLMFETNGELNG